MHVMHPKNWNIQSQVVLHTSGVRAVRSKHFDGVYDRVAGDAASEDDMWAARHATKSLKSAGKYLMVKSVVCET